MKLRLRKFKDTGKWYSDEEIVIDCTIADVAQKVMDSYQGRTGFIEILILEEDGHEQPFRMITL